MRSRLFFGLRRIHLFQDRFDLGDTPTLWPSLVERLKASKKLVVLLTYESELSPGMATEIAWWLEHRDPKDICLVALSGDLRWENTKRRYRAGSAMPELLQTYYKNEPFFFDLRGYRGQHDKAGDFIGDTFWALLANLLGTTADTVRRQDRKRRRLEVASAAAGLVLLALAGMVAVNAWTDARVEGALRADAENRIKANRLAAQSLALIERDPGASARKVQQAAELKETPQTKQAMHRVALRWPFLLHHWSIDTKLEAIAAEQDTGLLYLCGGSQLWTLDLETGSSPKHVEDLAIPKTPRATTPRCRFETASISAAKFLMIEFVVTSDDAMPTSLPGPTVYMLHNGRAELRHMGTPTGNATTVCASDGTDGLSFIRGGSAWLCLGGAPHRLSDPDPQPHIQHSLIESPTGLQRAFLHRSFERRAPSQGSANSSKNLNQKIIVFDPKSGDRKVQEIEIKYGERLSALAPGGATVGLTGLGGRGSFARLGHGATAIPVQKSTPQQDVDAIHFPNALGARWTIYSTPYSSQELERSFVEFSDRDGNLRFERFGDFRETPTVMFAPAPGQLLVATRSGRLEHYQLGHEETVVRHLSPPSAYRRFNACAPVTDADGVVHMLVSTPSGGLVLMRADNPAQYRTIPHRLSHGGYFHDKDPKQLQEAMGNETPQWLLQHLEARWLGVQAFKVGLTGFISSDDSSILAAILPQNQGVGVMIGRTPIEIIPSNRVTIRQQGNAKVAISPRGDLLTLPTKAGLALYRINRALKTVTHAADIPNVNAIAISADSTRMALARDLEIEVRRLHCDDNLACVGEPQAIEYRFQGHNNGIGRIAFDRQKPLLYSVGHDRRFVIYDLDSGTRLDADMPLHNDTIESLCALPDGGALSQDQSRLMLQWRLAPDNLSRVLQILAKIASPSLQ